MTTVKFKTESPYKTLSPDPPKVDTIYLNYLTNLNIENSNPLAKFGFALFGVGRAGTIHLSFLTIEKRVNLLYIVENDESKWNKLKSHWNLDESVQFLTSKDSLIVFKNPRIRAIVVSSPTYTHEKIVKHALQYNKAVFCEKPITGSIDQTKACYEKSQEVGQPLLSAFNRRFDISYESVRDRVRNGEIGQVLTIKVCSRDSPLPTLDYIKNSGGIFHDCAVHDIDMIVFVLGEYPTKVSAMAKANIPEIADIDDFDTVAILLSFDSGAIGSIDLSRHSTFGYDQRLEVFGQKGMIKAENQFPLHNIETYTGDSVAKSPIYYSFSSRFFEAYQREMQHFLDVLEKKSELGIECKDTLAVTRIASACEEAARTGKAVEIKWAKEDLPSTQVSTG